MKYMQNGQKYYHLSAVVVHVGHTLLKGHYIAFVHTESGWYEIDDSQVFFIYMYVYMNLHQ